MGQSGRRMMVRHEIGARHLAGKVAPLSRLERRGEVDLAYLHGVPIDAFKGLLLLVVLIGNKHGQVGNENGAGNDQTFHAHRTAAWRERHKAGPDAVDVMEREQVRLVKLRFDGLFERRADLLEDTVHAREDILRLHLGIAAIVWEARALADRHTALEVAGGEGGAEDEIASANGVRRAFSLDRVRAFGIVQDLPFEARGVRECNRIDMPPRAVEGEW